MKLLSLFFLREFLPVIGAVVLFGAWTLQQSIIEAQDRRSRDLANAVAVYQTYQSNNAIFNAILETSPDGIPTGQLLPVIDTCFDFRRAATMGAGLAQQHPQLTARGGYDHHWILNKTRPAAVDARLFSPTSGIQLHLSTNQAGVQFYSGNFLHSGTAAYFRDRAGLCIEPQGFPNAVNEPRFPSVILHPSQAYLHTTSYMYSVAR